MVILGILVTNLTVFASTVYSINKDNNKNYQWLSYEKVLIEEGTVLN